MPNPNLPVGTNNATITVSSTATDAAGNAATTATKVVSVDNTVSVPAIAISSTTGDNFSTDRVITASDLTTASGTIVVGGTSASGTVTLVVTDGVSPKTYTVASTGTWSITIPSADVSGFADGRLTLTASITVGGITNQDASMPTLDRAVGTPTVLIAEPVGDGRLSASEDDGVSISGTTTNVANGTSITVTVSDGTTT